MKNSQMYFLAMIISFSTDKWLLGLFLAWSTLYELIKKR